MNVFTCGTCKTCKTDHVIFPFLTSPAICMPYIFLPKLFVTFAMIILSSPSFYNHKSLYIPYRIFVKFLILNFNSYIILIFVHMRQFLLIKKNLHHLSLQAYKDGHNAPFCKTCILVIQNCSKISKPEDQYSETIKHLKQMNWK